VKRPIRSPKRNAVTLDEILSDDKNVRQVWGCWTEAGVSAESLEEALLALVKPFKALSPYRRMTHRKVLALARRLDDDADKIAHTNVHYITALTATAKPPGDCRSHLTAFVGLPRSLKLYASAIRQAKLGGVRDRRPQPRADSQLTVLRLRLQADDESGQSKDDSLATYCGDAQTLINAAYVAAGVAREVDADSIRRAYDRTLALICKVSASLHD